MRRAPLPLLLSLLVCTALARAQDDADRDAPVGGRAPAVVGWRVPSAALGQAAFSQPAAVSEDRLKIFRAELSSEPDGKTKSDLLGALSDLEDGAAKAKPEDRQRWIDGHLGTFNETLRTLGPDAPPELIKKAAKAAAKLNNAAQRWEDARGFASRALEFDPDDHDALISRSQAGAGLADFARAYADAERATKLAPDAAGAYTARAAASYGLGNYLQAVEDARRALALNPEDKEAFLLMKLSEGRTRASAPQFEKSAQPQLADSVEREYHGMVQQLNQVEERRLAPVEEPGPGAVARMTASAGSKLSVKDYWGAIDDADKALALDPSNARALYFRAAAHNLTGEYGDAARDATRGLEIKPSDSALHDTRAWAYNRMGRFVDAIADAHRSLEVDPKDAYAFANRAYADEQRGDYPAMAEDYKAAAALNAQFEPTYVDAARRHGLTPEARGSGNGALEAKLERRRQKRVRSFATIIASSLLGGLLIALGILHVNASLREKKKPTLPIPKTGIEESYALGEPIGHGGMGIVYEAVDRKLRRAVAIKMLRDEYKLDDAAKAGFMTEARTVAELHHPAIVDIHNIIEDERGLYLIFERLEGRTLDQVIGDGRPMRLSEIKRVLKPVCAALEYAHGQDVVHRDLKPSNIMLTSEGGVKVLDFGISRHAARAGKAATTQTVTGTPHYMAPEQEYGIVQKENDVFSLGAVLYEMVTGVRPYEGPHQAKLAKQYVRAGLRVEGAPPELDALIDRCLEPDPEKRMKSPAQFWLALSEIRDYVAPVQA
jgi:tetratricopeptide (TPR) repeat protein/tRNA A-37 threonylcarbamoyl transferase component Bud32